MAVFGNIEDLRPMFRKTEILEKIYSCLLSASVLDSEIGSKIVRMRDEFAGENLEKLVPLEEGAYMIISTCNTRKYENALFEAHREFIDIQMCVYGSECILLSSLKNGIEVGKYDEKKDISFYERMEKHSAINLESGDIAIFAPYDMHMPLLDGSSYHTTNQSQNLKPDIVSKIVVKVPASLIKLKM